MCPLQCRDQRIRGPTRGGGRDSRHRGALRSGSAQGAGLGLSIVSSIAQAHSGSVTAHPNPDGGLKIRISLPHLTDAPLAACIQTTSGAS
ncbi:hypothetical protein CG747_45385 [Streptomyces sp. CB02959]|nr:hypothetical protein CG747_45385 [Streptomyces sp. CB02959]